MYNKVKFFFSFVLFLFLFFWNFFFVINLNFNLLIGSVKKTGSFTYITMPWERYQYMYITYAQAFHWKSIIFFRKFLSANRSYQWDINKKKVIVVFRLVLFLCFFFWNFFFVINLNFDLLIGSVKKTGNFTYITMPWERYQYMYITYAQVFHWKSIIFFFENSWHELSMRYWYKILIFFVLFCFLFCFFWISFLSLTWILISL